MAITHFQSNMHESSNIPIKAVILIGGPSRGTRFRPLSLEIPKPLFPLAGVPMIYHHIAACAKLPQLKEILLVGFYESALFTAFIEDTQREFSIPIRYLREYQPLGTGGGLHHFRDQIMRGKPSHFLVLHGDICCSFPLGELLQFHQQRHEQNLCTVLGTKMSESHSNYGCIVRDESSGEVLHYVEKPETFVSDIINCGIYVFSPGIFEYIESLIKDKTEDNEEMPDVISLEKDVLNKLAGTRRLYVYETSDFWKQIKTAGSSVAANSLYLEHYALAYPDRLMTEVTLNGLSFPEGPKIIGNVWIHPEAKVHPSAVLGPNVSIGPKVTIAEGVRVKQSILLDRCELKKHCCVLYSVIGWDSKIGEWARIEGCKYKNTPNQQLMTKSIKNLENTIIGEGVNIANEIVIRNCIMLPHKDIKSNYSNEILM